MSEMKKISIMVPTYNEEENVIPLSAAIIEQFNTNETLKKYDYEILFIDNCSHDTTREKLGVLCASNPKIRAIFNARNFGQFNSPYHGICQTSGDCTIPLCADFQDPVEMIATLVEHWEKGYKIVCAVKTTSKENKLVRFFRTCYYKLIKKMSDVEQIEHFTGFGLYDKSFVDVLRGLDDPTPFIRGIVAELGFSKIEIPYEQAARRAGKTSNNFERLYDAAMLSFTTYTKTIIRFMTFLGVFLLACSGAGLLTCLILALAKAKVYLGIWWIVCTVGVFGSLNFIFLGMLGEYILTLKSKIMKRPLVIEEKRINFD
jgi:glycosyltransferase involved in cell wall biosynthesis